MACATKSEITLRGSCAVITEFFHYSLNNILYQRCIYPASYFEFEKKYGISLMVTKDQKLQEYLTNVLGQLDKWLMAGNVQKLVLVFMSAATREAKERWTFNVDLQAPLAGPGNVSSDKPVTEITKEIQGIMRQITASVSFLPVVDEIMAFDLLVYCDKATEIPKAWEESMPQCIINSQDVRLSSFNTKIHKVDAMVSYRCDDD